METRARSRRAYVYEHLVSGRKTVRVRYAQSAQKAVSDAKSLGYSFSFGAEQEFYLFRLDDSGEPTKLPYDSAGYMDIAPDDRGENIRREICLTLEQMGIQPRRARITRRDRGRTR